jgi:hypothetical protein
LAETRRSRVTSSCRLQARSSRFHASAGCTTGTRGPHDHDTFFATTGVAIFPPCRRARFVTPATATVAFAGKQLVLPTVDGPTVAPE